MAGHVSIVDYTFVVITSLAALLAQFCASSYSLRGLSYFAFSLTTQMPPSRPLPDLVLITVFKMLTPNEQMKASEMSLRCAFLVRAANRTVKTLAITDQNVENSRILDLIKGYINLYSLASNPALQPLMNTPDEPSFPDYPMTTHLSKWHCLKIDSKGQIDCSVIEQITTIFSAVTDLKFMTGSKKNGKHLVSLLQHPNWQCQLTSLLVDNMNYVGKRVDPELITTAINSLTALKQLALDCRYYTDLPHLTILAHLKAVAFGSDNLRAFVRSLEQYATENADLQVHLLSADIEGLLSQPLHSRIVHFEHPYVDFVPFLNLSYATRLCGQFRSLTSLTIKSIQFTEVVQLFTALSPLHQLVHLVLVVKRESDEKLPARGPPRLQAQMNSLRALELDLDISSHSDADWFNLPWTMPNLQTIYIQKFSCASCKVDFHDWRSSTLSLLYSPSTLHCFQSSLFTLHSGVLLNRFILRLIADEESISAEKLLLQSASEPVTVNGDR